VRTYGTQMSDSEDDQLDRVAASICEAQGLILRDHLGSGAFKTVFRVEDAKMHAYALKVIHGRSASPRTEREAEAIRRCSHPSIARLLRLDVHSYQDTEFDFTLEEYIDGGTLESRLANEGYLDDETAIELGESLIDALAHLAALGLVHRDIKPANIMYRAGTDRPVLVDFGLVRDLSASSLTPTHLGRGPGTPYFAAPEQLNNDKYLIDWRTDQFSLGVVLCLARFGLHPYQQVGEPAFSPMTVERVAERASRGSAFYENVRQSSLSCLDRMTDPWPISRFRNPDQLAEAWCSQKGN